MILSLTALAHSLLIAADSTETATPSTWAQLLNICFDGWAIQFKIGPVVYVAAGLITVVVLLLKRKAIASLWRQFDLVEAEASVFGLPKFTVRANRENVRIAYEAWVELVTRKAGLTFDEENDTIIEVYNSWHDLFGKLRCLAKSVPAHRLATCPDTRRLVEIMVLVLNTGLRPHLTKWQAKFRRWYEKSAADNPETSPQAIQQSYPEYAALVTDLKQVNSGIVVYANWLYEVASGKKSATPSIDHKQ